MDTPLKRSLSLPLILFYGVGTILGAGIYALIGEIAGLAKVYIIFSFLIAFTVALFTGFTYMEFASRYPQCAGAALYVHKTWNKAWLTKLMGWGIVLTGIVSAAAMTNGFAGYLQELLPVTPVMGKASLLIVLTAIAVIGINESITAITLITLIEIGGLIFVIIIVNSSSSQHVTLADVFIPSFKPHIWQGIIGGAFLAFYAFIGFEDMVNMAEETKNPQKILPYAILFSLVIAFLLYVCVALAAVVKMSPEKLAASHAPLTFLLQQSGFYSAKLITVFSLIAIVNGIIVQILMASRLLYGLSQELKILPFLTYVNPKTQTPVTATLFIATLILGFALGLPIGTLAGITAFIILMVFTCVNLALFFLKKDPALPEAFINFPRYLPLIAAILCMVFLLAQILSFYF